MHPLSLRQHVMFILDLSFNEFCAFEYFHNYHLSHNDSTSFTVLLISLLLETVVRSTVSLRFVWCAQHKAYLFLTYVAKMARQAVDRSAVLIWTRLDDTVIHAMSNMYVNFVYVKYENQVRSREMAIIYLSDFCVFYFLYTHFFLPFI